MKQLLKPKESNYKSRWAVVVLLLIMALTALGFRGWKIAEVKATEVNELSEIIGPLKEENTKLTIVAQVATASSKPVRLSKDQIKKVLAILMPKKEDQTRFMAILACENGTHQPDRINVNKEGLGYDLGIAQINSKFHSNRVKEFFGQEFNEAMSDPVRNLVYSVYLYQHQGFTPWVCDRKIAEGK